ncbi:MDR family MFS transporter [Aspergillus mulundensis]|uniref:Putative HC-toxin efflux carrier TOXA n=1 Tax=Aspergillus mulundensis TaxID=1810919 RepID=A0A3D8QZJ9_9EURO|nr:putative HC-toxin efflux carrier TOXA [Aspergillus mulundensis]RDW67185.1 putative HC-toxin efflux carrier TOXA [Aspergillus mulundensis]
MAASSPTKPEDDANNHAHAQAQTQFAAGSEETNANAMHGLKLVAIFIGICVGAFLMSLDIFVIATAIPSITSTFKDTSQLAWYPAAYTLTTCALTPLAGKLSSTFPLRWIYISFFSVFLLGSLVCGFAPNSNTFIAGRAIAGIGASGVASGGFVIVLTVSPEKSKPLLLGICSSCFALGLVLAPVIGGAFTEKASWRWCFWVNLPPGGLALLSMLCFFKPPAMSVQREQTVLQRLGSLDLVGCAVFIPAIFMLLLAMMWGGTEKDWDSATIIGLFVGAGVLLILFVAWEGYQGEGAMIPGEAIARRSVAFAVLFSFCHFGSLGILNYYLPEWFQAVQGASPLQSGTRVLASVLAQILGTLGAGFLARKIHYYNPWLYIGPALMCTAAALYTQFSTFSTPASHWIGFQVIQGLGVGMAQQMPALIVQHAVRDKAELMPVAVSLNLFFQYLGATVTQVLGGIVFRSILGPELARHAGLDDAQIALLQGAGTAGVRRTAEGEFPERLDLVLEAYNEAITATFFVAVATTATAFFLAFGVEWERITEKKATGPEETGPETR